MDFSNIRAPEPCSRLAGPTSTVCGDEFQRDSFEEIPERLEDRLRDMQELVWYLLRKDEELRMEIFARRERRFELKSSAISCELELPNVGMVKETNPRVYEPNLRAQLLNNMSHTKQAAFNAVRFRAGLAIAESLLGLMIQMI